MSTRTTELARTFDVLDAVASQPEEYRRQFIAHLSDAHATKRSPDRERWVANTEAYIEFMTVARLVAQLPLAERPVFSEPSLGLTLPEATAHLRRITLDLYRYLGCAMPSAVAAWEQS